MPERKGGNGKETGKGAGMDERKEGNGEREMLSVVRRKNSVRTTGTNQ